MFRRLYRLLPFLPLVGAGVFLYVFASPTPLTDEWNFMHGARRLSQARTLTEIIDGMVWFSYTHCTVVPFLVYLPIEFLAGFDSRALMVLTLLCHSLMLFTIARRYSPPPWILLAASLVLFSPARYVELLWGFEFVLALSIAFSVWGLFVLSGGRAEEGEAAFARRLAWALLLFTLSVMSSAGGYFGFLAAVPVIALRRIRIRWKVAAVLSSLLMAYGFYALAVQPETGRHFEADALVQVLTFAGAALLSSPTAIDDFSLHQWSILGGVVFLLTVLTIVYAARMRLLDEGVFAIGLIAYGALSIVAISVNRAYAANWHVQHVLPLFAGTLGLAWLVWKRTARRSAGILCAAVVLTTAVGGYGWYYGWKSGGPEFSAYAREIEGYIRTFDRAPGQPPPFPPMGPWVVTHELTAFFRAVEHPVLMREPP